MEDNLTYKNVIIIKEVNTTYNFIGIHYENSNTENYSEIQKLFAVLLIIAKCKHIICSSNNFSIWTMYYRGNAENVNQNLNKTWL